MPNFSQNFIVECDASGEGLGAVLMQHQQPICYFSKAIKGKNLYLSTYDKELLALVTAIRRWRHYLFGQHFIVRTDQQALKYLLEQRIGTPTQQKWVAKLLGYDFSVEYKSGKQNIAADALSRRDNELNSELPNLILNSKLSQPSHQQAEVTNSQLHAISLIQPHWIQELKNAYQQDSQLQKLISDYHHGILDQSKYQMNDELLFYKKRIHLGNIENFKKEVLQQFHSHPLAGHTGIQKTYSRIKKEFYWDGLKGDVKKFVQECDICQRNKTENIHPAGLLQPLPIPNQNWKDISMDFIEGLPPSKGKTTILVIVDRLSKYAHFIAINHPYTANDIAKEFFNHIFRLHGLPNTIVSDRDAIFTSQFWKELFRLSGTELLLSSAYHPQTDGQTEIVNKGLECYLRYFSGERPKDWSKWLTLAEYAYNTMEHTSTKLSPYEIVYGQKPPRLMPYEVGSTMVQAVEEELRTRDVINKLVQENLKEAQNRMKTQADKKRTDREFEVGSKVYLRLQPYRQMTAAVRRNLKLSPRFYGPYTVLKRIGKVAYQLDLPPGARIHPVFHVSCLKKKLGEHIQLITDLPRVNLEGQLESEPEGIIERRIFKKRNQVGMELLVKWKGLQMEDATWVDLEELRRRYPDLEGKVF